MITFVLSGGDLVPVFLFEQDAAKFLGIFVLLA
jgi:hypothetical protein